jgi:hypothetical protein
MKTRGFLYVASLSEAYYKAAVFSAMSLKDYYPEANITLFTHEKFIKDVDRKFFDNIITNIPIHKRAKMWGMARTPYDITLYLDADTEIRSENIKNVFDILNKNDIMFTKIVPHVSNGTKIDDENDLEYHGGIILYNNKKTTINFINDWYDLYDEQMKISDWKNSKYKAYIPRMQGWDQFTIWWMFRQPSYKKIKHDFFPDGGYSYNFIYLLEEDNVINIPYKKLEQIIFHYTIPREKVNAGNLKIESRTTTNFN